MPAERQEQPVNLRGQSSGQAHIVSQRRFDLKHGQSFLHGPGWEHWRN
jgi:hypothetical protein